MMKWTVFSVFIFACIFSPFVWADAIDDSNIDPVMARVYRAVLLKSKRSPSMGLSLAEYMASPHGGDNFHFIPSGRK
ncbi:hypothetical protein KIN20_037277 [Parelaphostrongylus tenuis]|uniref:Uncharacterized protein n=1 Tax=Parelaphostrongylus tenuis TaxID=148309 RepID=A0AAD5WLZ7_PARTN|nr:hypothetical protein KIN20_037277 [Parelaphostrongylus tenuis]